MFKPIRQPAAATAIACAVLDEQIPRRVADWSTAADGRGCISMIPAFTLSARQVGAAKWRPGRHIGWRYFWTHPSLAEGALMEIARTGGEPQLTCFRWSAAAPRQVGRLEQLAEYQDQDPRRYRVRLLSLPWISCEAVWFSAIAAEDDDLFFGISPLLSGMHFLDEARDRERKRREFHAECLRTRACVASGVAAS